MLVVILLLLFLGNLRAAIVVALILPLSVLATFVLMRQFGLSANLMSLGGLAIAIGLLVDAAVVVVENVVRASGARPGEHQRNTVATLLWATQEVASPVTSGIAIIAIVFLPLLTLEGLEGKLFAPVALTIVFALAASLLLALTVIPVLASMLLKQGRMRIPWLLRKAQGIYTPLRGALARPKWVYATAGVLMLAAVGVYPLIGKTFMPTMDEGDILVQLEKLPSISLEESVAQDLRVQQALLKNVPEIRRIVAAPVPTSWGSTR